MEDCVFCKIARGEIPCQKVWEDKDFLAFLDINPFTKGHVLIIPKEHSRWVWDIENENYSNLMDKVYYFANVLRKTFDTEWVEEVVAGVGVEHAHIHLLPRTPNDGFSEIPKQPLDPKPSEKEMNEILDKIKKNL